MTSSAPEPYKISPDSANPTRVDLIIINQEKNSIYVSILQIVPSGVMNILHPSDWSSPENAPAIEPGQKLSLKLRVVRPAGFFEILVITSASPLRDSLKGLQTIATSRNFSRGYMALDGKTRGANDSSDNVVSIAQDYIRDLTYTAERKSSRNRRLDPQQSAIFSTVFQVIE